MADDHGLVANHIVDDWSWEETDTGAVILHGKNEDGETVVKREFVLQHTLVKNTDDNWEIINDDGGWPRKAKFIKHKCERQ